MRYQVWKGCVRLSVWMVFFFFLVSKIAGIVKEERQIENELILTSSAVSEVSILDMQEDLQFEDLEFKSMLGKRVMRIKISHNSPDGFKLGIYSQSGKFKIATSYEASLSVPELPGTSIEYSFSIVNTSLGFLGTDFPLNLSQLPMAKVPTFIFFNTGVNSATVEKYFDFYIQFDQSKINALLTKQGYAYFDKIYLVISDAL